jgi:hypothetical protein
MDGSRYTYVKTNPDRRLQWRFLLTREKSLELRAFFQSYYRARVRVVDHDERVWIGYFTSNPFEFEAARPEVHDITIEFQGTEDA